MTGYRPREPERTVLHRVVGEHLETFLAEARARDESAQGVPDFVEDEFRRFLGCGSLVGGFARLKCETCGHEKLVPFSCKRRGICPSCTAASMASLPLVTGRGSRPPRSRTAAKRRRF